MYRAPGLVVDEVSFGILMFLVPGTVTAAVPVLLCYVCKLPHVRTPYVRPPHPAHGIRGEQMAP